MAKKKIKKTVTTVTEEIITNEKTQIVCILDRSGSMSSIINDSIGGFNSYLEEQKKLPDEATITVALFDDRYDLLYDNVDINKIEMISKDVWIPRGMTALYDAIGKTINTVRETHKKLGNEKPDKVLVCIVTDGEENNSNEYTCEDIKKLIKDCENDNWNFIYLAANQDAFKVGRSFGVSAGNTYTYSANSIGVSDMSATLNSASTYYRSVNSTSDMFDTLSKNLIDTNDEKE